MPIATSLIAALLASPVPAGAASPATLPPPLVVNLSMAATISSSLLSRVLAEADAIWRRSGVTFVWQRAARDVVPYARTGETGSDLPSRLRVVIGNDTGVSRDHTTPLGWIAFDDEQTPEPEIYISYANACRLMEASSGVIGMASQMLGVQRELLVSRVMGRALAHEMGHYLLASKAHTPSGLMQGRHPAYEFFSTEPSGFRINTEQRRSIAARLRGESLIVSR